MSTPTEYKPKSWFGIFAPAVLWAATSTWLFTEFILREGWWLAFAVTVLFLGSFLDEANRAMDKDHKAYFEYMESLTPHRTVSEVELRELLWDDRNRAEREHGPGAWDVADVLAVIKHACETPVDSESPGAEI